MWSLLFLYLYSFCVNAQSDTICHKDMDNQDIVEAFRERYDDFSVRMFKIAIPRTYDYIIISPFLSYITLIAIAEGADSATQNEMFDIMNLPKDICSRQKYYSTILSVISKSESLQVDYNNVLFIDKEAQLNMHWYNNFANKFIHVIPVPMKNDPESTLEKINQIVSLQSSYLDFSGNSIIINSLNYSGLWTTSFADAVIQNQPFYNQEGQKIGYVDFMKVKREFNIGYSASIFSKLIDLPVSVDGKYRMFVGIINDDATLEEMVMSINKTAIKDIVASVQDNYELLEVSIPRFEITSTVDMMNIFQNMGITNLWKDPTAARNISTPPTQPSSYIQSVTVNFNTKGINPPPSEYNSDKEVKEFIANKPFSFALYDAKTYANMIVGVFTKPKNKNS